MNNFIAAFAAEHIKKKGTGLYFVAAIVAAIIPVLRLIVKIFIEKGGADTGFPVNYFEVYLSDCMMVFTMFFFPLIIIITVSRITQLDHRNGGWQLMETQPLEKFSIYFSKFLVILIANSIAIVSLIGFALICAAIGILTEDHSPLNTSIPFIYILKIATRLFVASLFITALQFVIAVLMPSFIWSMLIGFFLYTVTGILTALQYLPDWYPYGILTNVGMTLDGSDLGYWFLYTEHVSWLAALLLLGLGFQWYKFKYLKRAFFGNPKRGVISLVGIAILCGTIIYALKPNQMDSYQTTVIAGKIEGDVQVKNVLIINPMFRDTLLTIPVNDGKFSAKTTHRIVADHYLVEFGKSYQQPLFFGTNDSVFMHLKLANNNAKFKVTGTRLAENQSQKESFQEWSRVAYYLENNEFIAEPEEFSSTVYDEWKDRMSETNRSKTVDNYVPRQDFIARNQSLTTVKYLAFWEDYVGKRKNMFPKEQTAEPVKIKLIRKKLSLTDESLLSDDTYFAFVLQQMAKNDKRQVDDNTKQETAILKLPKSPFRDKMLFLQLENKLKYLDNEEGKALIASNSANFLAPKFVDIIQNNAHRAGLLRSGMPAPIFEASTIKGENITSEKFKGKVVVIDTWATWCVPCEEQSNYFERLAVKYNSKHVNFVALSIDQKKQSWLIKAKKKSPMVTQLHSNDLAKFSHDYNIETIPRFILIDEAGNLIESAMPYPSEKSFEILLKEAMKIKDN
jgi:thiol-disulfide isomerase/thioredoxin